MEPKLTGYVNANAGYIKNAAKDVITVGALGLGAKIESNGYYAQAEGGYGRVIYAKAEIGKISAFDESNFGLKTSLAGQYIIEHKERDYYRTVNDVGANSPTWKSNDLRCYGEVALTYNSPSFRASAGVMGGVKTCTQASLDGVQLAQVGEIDGAEYPGRTTKGFVTPKIELEAGKKLCFCAGLTLDELRIGGKLYF